TQGASQHKDWPQPRNFGSSPSSASAVRFNAVKAITILCRRLTPTGRNSMNFNLVHTHRPTAYSTKLHQYCQLAILDEQSLISNSFSTSCLPLRQIPVC